MGSERLINLGSIIYFTFIIIIIVAIIMKKKPVLIGAMGLLIVGIAESRDFFKGVQIAFKGLVATTTDLLAIILLIGLVVALTTMLKETEIDKVIIKPLLRVTSVSLIYWLLGITAWLLTLFLWPTPAITLLGAVILPILNNNAKIHPLGLAVGLCIFGEGIGLSGDYVIQGAPGLLALAAGLEIEEVIAKSVPLVLGSGFIASGIGYWKYLSLNKIKNKMPIRNELPENSKIPKVRDHEQGIGPNKKRIIAGITVATYLTAIVWLLSSGLRGDSAAAVTGGISIFVLIMGALVADRKTALNAFGQYLQSGMRFSMEVFAPVIIIASFFLLGTQGGSEEILGRDIPGYLEQMAIGLSRIISLDAFSCSVVVVLAAILGAMSGSGFSALPLVGGVAAALGQEAGLPVIELAVLGQVAAIWTDAAIIPWGFPAVVSAVTKTEAVSLVRQNILPWAGALTFSMVWTIYML